MLEHDQDLSDVEMDEVDQDPGANDKLTENELDDELREIPGLTTNDEDESDDDRPVNKVKHSYAISTPVCSTRSSGKLNTRICLFTSPNANVNIHNAPEIDHEEIDITSSDEADPKNARSPPKRTRNDGPKALPAIARHRIVSSLTHRRTSSNSSSRSLSPDLKSSASSGKSRESSVATSVVVTPAQSNDSHVGLGQLTPTSRGNTKDGKLRYHIWVSTGNAFPLTSVAEQRAIDIVIEVAREAKSFRTLQRMKDPSDQSGLKKKVVQLVRPTPLAPFTCSVVY